MAPPGGGCASGSGRGLRASGTWRVRSARPWARAHLAVDQLPPPAHFGRQAPPGGGRASDTGPRGSATGREGSVPPQPDIKNASGIYFITFINIVILFPACRALIRNVGACTPRLVQMGRPGPGEETPTASTRPALDGRGPHPGHSRGFEGSPAGLPDVARPLGRGPFRAGGGSGKAGSSGISLHKGKGGRSPGLGAGMGAPGEGRGSPQRGPGQRGHSPGKADARGPERRPLKKGSGVRQVGTLWSLR